jgi:hypothetical protein
MGHAIWTSCQLAIRRAWRLLDPTNLTALPIRFNWHPIVLPFEFLSKKDNLATPRLDSLVSFNQAACSGRSQESPSFIPKASFDPNMRAARDRSNPPSVYSTYSTTPTSGCSQSKIPRRLAPSLNMPSLIIDNAQNAGSRYLSSGLTSVPTTQRYQFHGSKQQKGRIQIRHPGDKLVRRGTERTAARVESERRRRDALKASFVKLRSALGASDVRVGKRDLLERASWVLGHFKLKEEHMLQELKYLRGVGPQKYPNSQLC